MDTTETTARSGKGPQDIVVFGKIDRKHGKADNPISSSYPAWYHDQLIEDTREEHDQFDRALKGGFIPSGAVHEAENKRRNLREKLDLIDEGRPKLNAAQKAWLVKVAGDLSAEVAASEFSYDDMNLGIASPHDEMRRMTRPCVKIDPVWAEKCNCKVDPNGKSSRNEAKRALKIANKLLGEPTNTEYLRQKALTCRTKRIDPFVGGGSVGRSHDVEGAT
jgi:hypothetical protein